jgi:hypothetical protein
VPKEVLREWSEDEERNIAVMVEARIRAYRLISAEQEALRVKEEERKKKEEEEVAEQPKKRRSLFY